MKKVINWVYVKDIAEDEYGNPEVDYYITNTNSDNLVYDGSIWGTKLIDNWWFKIDPDSGRLAKDSEIPEDDLELGAYAKLIDLSSVPLPEDGEIIEVIQKIEQSINYSY